MNLSLKAIFFFGFFEFEFSKFGFLVFVICTVIYRDVIRVDRFDNFTMVLKDRGCRGSEDFTEDTSWKAMYAYFADLCFVVSTTGVAATEVC